MLYKVLTQHTLPILSCWVFLFFASCVEPETIGLEVQPQDDQINAFKTDTISLITYTKTVDSLPINTSSSNLPIALLLGSYTDEEFGLSNARFYTQFNFSSSGFTYGDFASLDSIVLTLAYGGSYGDTSTLQTIHIVELAEDLESDTTYYTNKTFAEGQSLGTFSTDFNPSDTLIIGGDTLSPHLRIPLDTLLGNFLIDFSRTSSRTDEELLNVFKGVCVRADDVLGLNQGSILTFNPTSSLSKITVYYHTDTEDSLEYDYVIDGNTIRTLAFNHDYSTAPNIMAQLMDSTLGQQTTYVQAMSGVKTIIKFPYLEQLKNFGNIAINQAELTVPVKDATIATFDPNNAIILLALDSLGNEKVIVDLQDSQIEYGGFINDDKTRYKFNFTRHFQRLLSGQEKNYGMVLIANNATLTPNRVILEGGKDTFTNERMKLQLKFSILD